MTDFLDFSVLLEEDDEEDEEYIPVEEEDDDDDEEEGAAPAPGEAEVGDLNDLIACRTRSKFQIEQDVGDTLHLPDVELDLYDVSEEDDMEWSGFCASLFADDPVADADDDDENDPEYVAGDEEPHFHDKQDCRISIPPVEADSLLDDDVPVESLASPIENATEWSACFTADHMEQLKDQFAMYLQLLAQQYFLCRERETLLASAFDCVGKVAEISELSETCEVANAESLSPVISLIREHPIKSVRGKFECYNWRKCGISFFVRNIIVRNPHVFVCERLIPQHGYYDVPKNKSDKTIFSAAEDDLIILGLLNFQNHGNAVVRRRYVKFICDLILPSKTESQLKARIKNCRRRFDPNNRLSLFLKKGTISPSVPIPVNRRKTAHNEAECPQWMATMMKSSPGSCSPPAPPTPVKCNLLLPSALRVSSNPFKQAYSIVRKYRLISSRSCRPDTTGRTSDVATPAESNELNDGESTGSIRSPLQSVSSNVSDDRRESDVDAHRSGDEDEDDESELAALMAASSTITISRMKLNKKVNSTKQDALNKQKEISRKILADDRDSHDPDQEMRQQTIVENFMQKARDVLHEEEDFVRFLKLLSEFHESRQTGRNEQSLKEVFKNLESFLTSLHGERLMDELILFLDQKEALECGKMYEYLHWKRLTSFMRKIEVATAIDSQMLLRLFKTLTQLRQNPLNADKNRIKAAVHKAVNGHPLLMAEFMTLFLDETPPAHLFKDEQDFDHVVCNSDDDNEDCSFESCAPIPSDNESAYGTPDCPCTHCHRSPGEKTKHCNRCCLTIIDNQLHILNSGKAVAATLQYTEKTDVVHAADHRDSPKSAETACKKQRTGDEWCTEDDAVLLQVVQTKLTCTDLIENHVFEDIAKQVNKSFEQVSARFAALMHVIRELPSPEKSFIS